MIRALLVVLALGACEPPGPRWQAAGSSVPRSGGTLRLSTTGPIATLDPAYAYDETTFYALHAIFDTLLDFDRDARLVPRLAAAWTATPDARQYTFTLRPGLRYADGTPIVADDIAHAIARVQRTADSPFQPFVAGVHAVRARDAHTLVVELAAPDAAFANVLAMKFTAPQRSDGVLRASGPYQQARWDRGQRLELARNAHYHDPARQRPAAIVLLESIAPETQFLMFERGELDVAARLTAPDQLWVRAHPAWRAHVHARPVMTVFGARMNVTRPPFDDVRVRRALNLALNKEHVLKLLAGTGVVAHGLLPPGTFGRDDARTPYPHDPVAARALLAAAGHGGGLRLAYVTWPDELAQKLAVSMQADFAAVGVTLEIETMAPGAWAAAVARADGPPFSIATWLGDFPDPTSFLDAKLHSRGISDAYATNDSFYRNPTLDALLDRARAEADPAARAALYREAERIVFDDAPWIFGYHGVATEVVQPYVRDYAPHPIWVRDLTSAWLDLGPDGSPVPR